MDVHADDDELELEPRRRLSGRPEPQRDRWKRAMLLGLDGERKPYTRVSTLAKALDDKEGLTNWKQRCTTVGLRMRPDLWALACAIQDPEGVDKPEMRAIVDQAADIGDVKQGANQGTARHKFTEAVERGTPIERLVMDDDVKRDVEAYFAEMERLGLEVVPEYSEVHVVREAFDHNGCGYSGTMDNAVRDRHTRTLIGADKKTGQSLKYAILAWTIQVACYVNAEHAYDVATDTRQPMPELDKSMGLLLWLPTGHGRLQVYELDIEAGWEFAHLAVQVRAARARGKVDERMERCLAKLYDPTKARQLTLVPAGRSISDTEAVRAGATKEDMAAASRPTAPLGGEVTFNAPAIKATPTGLVDVVPAARAPDSHPAEVLNAALDGRRLRLNERLKSMSPEGQGHVVAWWEQWNARADVPIPPLNDPAARHTVAQLNQVEAWANEAEKITQEDLAPPDIDRVNAMNLTRWFPGTIDEGTTDVDQAAVQAKMAQWCPPQWQGVIVDWLDDAERCGRTWRLSECPTTRRAALYELAGNLAAMLEGDREQEQQAVAVLVTALRWGTVPDVPLGFMLALLTLEEIAACMEVVRQVPFLALHFRTDGVPFWGPAPQR